MNRTLWWTSLGFFLWSAATNLAFPFLPLAAADYGAGPLQAGLVQGAAYAGAALALFPAALIAGRYGGRATLLAAWTAGAVGALLMALASTWQGLLPGACLLLAGAGAIPALAALVSEQAGHQSLRRAMNLVFAAAPAGLLAGSSAAGLLAEALGMRALFVGAAILSVVAIAAVLPAPATRPAVVAEPAAAPAPAGGSLHKLLLIGIAAGAGYLLLSLPSGFMTPYMRDVVGLSLSGTGITNAQLAVGQLAWSGLFAVWPGNTGTVALRAGQAIQLTVNRSTLLAIGVCLGANAAFGFLFPVGTTVAIVAAIVLRGALFSLQPLGMALVSEVTGTGNGLTGRFSLLALVLGLATAGAPVAAGTLYARDPAWPFWVTAVAAAIGMVMMLGLPLLGTARRHSM